jgi:imidazolonepropionase-like amidohydrolase
MFPLPSIFLTTLLIWTSALGTGTLAPNAPNPDEPKQGPQDGVFVISDVQVWNGHEVVGPMDLLLRDGWIEVMVNSAHQDLKAPADAIRIQAEADWVVYPGLIHADWGKGVGKLPDNPYHEVASNASDGPVPNMEYGDRRYLRGWLKVADVLDWDEEKAEDWRELGFTSAQILPTFGILRGRSAVVSLNELPLGEALLQRNGHQIYSMRSFGGYPGTPMAGLAVLRQVFLDHQRLHDGNLRHRNDPDLADLGPAIFLADGRREIENILDLQRDFAADLPTIILGGDQAWEFSDRLIEQNVAVLYIADFGEALESDEDLEVKAAEERPYWQEPAGLREGERSLHAERVAGFLQMQAAGVRCAIVPTEDADEWKDAFKQMAEVEGGSAAQLWQAASADVATVLGLPAIGKIEAGAGADLVIFQGDPGPEGKVAWVFADGRGWEFEIAAEEEADEAAAEGEGGEGEKSDSSAADTQLDGTWKLTVNSPMGEQVFYAIIDVAKNSVQITDEPGNDEDKAKGVSFKGDRVKFTYMVEEMDMEFTFFGKVNGDKMSAKLKTDFGDVPAKGARVGESKSKAAKEPATESGEAEGDEQEGAESAEEEEQSKGVALGHPDWLVETREDRQVANPYTGSVFIQGGTLYPMDGGEAYVGDLLIEDGKIKAIGKSLSAPDGVPVYDATGMHVSPAMMDAHSHLALASVNEGSMSITAEVRIADMIRARNYGIYRAAAGGTALAQSLHGSANPIGGQAAVWELNYYADRISDLLYQGAPQGIKFALGENVKQSNWNNSNRRFPATRMGVQAVYRRAFTAAQDYAERRRRNADGELPNFRRDVRLEVLADILDNVIHIQCHSYRADELLMFLNICKEFGVERPTFQHILEGYKVAPELAAYGAMGSTFADWWAYKIEAYDAIPWNVNMMNDAGMVATINSDSNDLIRRLNTEAGKSMRYGGAPWQVAMSYATTNVAKQLQIDSSLGSLEVGKDGTIAIYDAHPMSTYARCHLTLARGRTLFEWKPDNDETWQAYGVAVAAFAESTRARNQALQAEADATDAADAADATDADSDAVASGEADTNAGPGSAENGDPWEAWTRLGQGESYLISNARIHSMVPGEEPYKGWLMVVDGRITKLGRNEFRAQMSSSVREVNARGMDLYPGFINGTDVTGILEISSVAGTNDTAETSQDHPDLSVAAAIHADSAHHRVTRLNGITHVLVRPKRGRMRGQAALIQLAGDTTDQMVVQKDLGLVISFPRATAPELGQLGREFDLQEVDCLTAGRLDLPAEVAEAGLQPRDGVEMPDSVDELDEWFDNALQYGKDLENLAASGQKPLMRDLQLEALLPYARGEKPVLVEANDAITIMAARAWAKDRELDVIYLGVKEGWKVAGYLGADRARVIVGSVHDLPPRANDPYDSIFRSASVLQAAGCEVALRTDNLEVTRNLPFQAATAATWGLGRDQALQALTLGAAKILGVDQYTGSIEIGKSANFFLCSGDPLDFPGQIKRMWIGGHEVEMTSRQTELRDRYAKRIEKAGK